MVTGSQGARPDAVVLGGVGAALSITRSLSRHGVRVWVLGAGDSLVAGSRHCAQFVDLGAGEGVQARWLDWLADGPRGAVLLPAGDDGLELVARNRAALEELGYIPVEANDEVLLAMLDKGKTHEFAARAGVPVPATMPVSSAGNANEVAERVGFPCALKPVHSHLFMRHFTDKVLTVDDAAQFEQTIAKTNALGLQMVATEVIPGGDDLCCSYYSYIDADGEPLFHFTKRKLRQQPIHFGLGTYHVTSWAPDVAEAGLDFFQKIGVRGLANVEFKRDPRDGSLQLIECNYRFTAQNELVRASGLDLAVLSYEHLLGRAVQMPSRYRVGLHSWSPIEDFRAAREYVREGELSYLGWLRSLIRRQQPYFFDWRDPGPTVKSFALKVRRRLRRSGGRRRRQG